jgi:ribonuclease HI
MQHMQLLVHTDGGSRGNPGPAACGFVLRLGDSWQWIDGIDLGAQTNNVAEYQGILAALHAVASHLPLLQQKGMDSVLCHLDSELVVKQLQGLYKVKDGTLQDLHAQVKVAMHALPIPVTVTHVRREQNKLADLVVNAVLDGTLDILKTEYRYDRN